MFKINKIIFSLFERRKVLIFFLKGMIFFVRREMKLVIKLRKGNIVNFLEKFLVREKRYNNY